MGIRFCILLCLPLLAFAATASASSDKKPAVSQNLYLPLDSSVYEAGKNIAPLWDLTGLPMPGPEFEMSFTEHGFSAMSLEAALKLGLADFGLDASGSYSVLVAESRRYQPVPVTLQISSADKATAKVATSSFAGTALIGCACRVNVLAKTGVLGANLTAGGVGLEAHVKAITETMSFAALGFTNYAPLKLPLTGSGNVDLGEIRRSMLEIFDAYSSAAGDNIRPRIIGIKVAALGTRLGGSVSVAFPKVETITNIVVTKRQ